MACSGVNGVVLSAGKPAGLTVGAPVPGGGGGGGGGGALTAGNPDITCVALGGKAGAAAGAVAGTVG